ncbi:MAG TPA: patatin-like phospholipase family protein [bacterium]|nr:patatin-like phospholipase family protein [bacterium]
MGIRIVQKSDLTKKKHHSKIALVLAGGAISGGAFKAGGLKALNDFLVNRKVTDFDIYVGTSAGGFLAAPLAGGIPPEEILKSLDGTSEHFSQLTPLDIYNLNWREMIEKPVHYLLERFGYFPNILLDFFQALPNIGDSLKKGFLRFVNEPNYSNYEKMVKPLARALYSGRSAPSILSAMPTGFFDNQPLERFLAENMKRNHLSNHFKVLKRMRGKDLYICAMTLDTSDRAIFGWDEKNDVTISQAVQASTAMPGFYKPVRIKGVDYIDGGVLKTANIDLALEKGAELVICYNPFRPLKNLVNVEYLREKNRYVARDPRISDNGVFGVFNQVFRTLYHQRLQDGIKRLEEDKGFKGDIILVQPKEDDATFFQMNPFAFWTRANAAKSGFESVRMSILDRFDEIKPILASYGIEMTRELVEQDAAKIQRAANDEREIMDVLEGQGGSRSRLRIILGGRKAKASSS